MGSQCVRPVPKNSITNHFTRMGTLSHELRNCDEDLLFTMTIQHLRLTNMTKEVKEIKFSLQNEFEIVYCLNEFSIQESLIKSEKIHKTQFRFPAKCLDEKKVIIQIVNFQDQVIQYLRLKLTHLCTGPIHHDYLLKELKARLMFDLHLYQNINLFAKCKDLKIEIFRHQQFKLDDLSYRFTLTTENDEKTYQSLEGYLANEQIFQEKQIFGSVPNNQLKESNFRFEFLKRQLNDNDVNENSKVIHSMFVPYRKVEIFDTFTSLRKKQIDYVKKCIPFEEILRFKDQAIGKVTFLLEVQSSILYTEQMECLIFSQIGVSTVSPTVSYQENDVLVKQLKQIYKSVKKIKTSLPEHKSELIRNIDQIYLKFQKSNEQIFTCEQELYQRQMTLVKLLNQLSQFFQEGQDILNQRLWRTINHIVHKPELSTRYLTLHQNENTKKDVYLRYYQFIITVLSKVMACTGAGITFHELQCIQKFIAFSYFRFPWIQDVILHALRREADPVITEEKLIEYGVSYACKSPSKSYVYDWETNIYRKIAYDKQFQDELTKLQAVSQNFEGWDKLLFNRDDQDLFYGLYLQIWTEAQITLRNLKGKILWEYFPNYGQLLSCFLGQMNHSKISDFSSLFKQCSNKLVLNEKLLNTFVIQLFPKTHLFETSCVLKCLNLLESYFQVLSKQNKKLPHDFHFNFFYTGITSIFQQNHSYLVVKTLYILYKYYDIFTQQFKKILNSFLFSKIFYNLFLHWCTNVRKMFHHLILYKILQKKVTNPEEVTTQSSNKNHKTSTKGKQQNFSEDYLINRKITIFIRSIQSYCYDLKKVNREKQKIEAKPYYLKMKAKLAEKKLKKQREDSKLDELSQSKVSDDGVTSAVIMRKQSMFTENIDFQFCRMRKLSVSDQIYSEEIQEEYRKYCVISMNEYQEVKRVQNSSLEVDRLAQLVQGDIDS